MGTHSFSLDPRTILGVGSSASRDEIREAYHFKSKKHHPDLGGDEWAFRMVARAIRSIKGDDPGGGNRWRSPTHGWTTTCNRGVTSAGGPEMPEAFRTVDVSLIWMRFEAAGTTQRLSLAVESEETLSVCMVISWPDALSGSASGRTRLRRRNLRTLVELFHQLRGSQSGLCGAITDRRRPVRRLAELSRRTGRTGCVSLLARRCRTRDLL